MRIFEYARNNRHFLQKLQNQNKFFIGIFITLKNKTYSVGDEKYLMLVSFWL